MSNNESIKKIVIVSLGVCLVCSLFVASAAVSLSERQAENKRLDKIKNILVAGELYSEGSDLAATYAEKITPAIVELKTGKILTESEYNDVLHPETFELLDIIKNTDYSRELAVDENLPKLERLPSHMLIYFAKDAAGNIEQVILPIFGKGLWSTLYGFLALNKDASAVTGITYYAHGETPGLGGEVENPRWRALWKGKEALDENWNLKLRVVKGAVDPTSPQGKYSIDGMAGATITTRGVDYMIKFWLGENGYLPLLKDLREGNNE